MGQIWEVPHPAFREEDFPALRYFPLPRNCCNLLRLVTYSSSPTMSIERLLQSNAVHTPLARLKTVDVSVSCFSYYYFVGLTTGVGLLHLRHTRRCTYTIKWLISFTLSSTFTFCACGARARDCALTEMVAFVDGKSTLRTFPSNPKSRITHTTSGLICKGKDVNLGPLVGSTGGFGPRSWRR